MYSNTTVKISVRFDIFGLVFISEMTQMNNDYLSSIWTKDLWKREFHYLKIENFKPQEKTILRELNFYRKTH